MKSGRNNSPFLNYVRESGRQLEHRRISDNEWLSGAIVVTGSLEVFGTITNNGGPISGGPGGGPVTGSDYFYVKNNLDVQGALTSSVGHVILSTSFDSKITVSGNLNVLGVISGAIDSVGVNTFTASLNTLSQSLNAFTASVNIFSQSVNSFTASFSASAASISRTTGDARYVLTSSGVEQRVQSGLVISGTTTIIGGVLYPYSGMSTGGNVTFTGQASRVVNSSYDLILSASTSKTTISGNLNVLGSISGAIDSGKLNDFTASINTLTQSLNAFTASINIFSQSVNGFTSSFTSSVWSIGDVRYVLTSSGVEQRIQSDLVSSGTLKIKDTLSNYSQHLILSSSVGSVVGFSASQEFNQIDKNYHINSKNSPLILSATGGSTVHISGNLSIGKSSSFGYSIDATGVINTDSSYRISSSNVLYRNGVNTYLAAPNQNLYFQPGNTSVFEMLSTPASGTFNNRVGHLILSSSVGSVVSLSSSLELNNVSKNYQINAINTCLILSSTATSDVCFSASAKFSEGNKPYHIVATNNHLILSSSAGSYITISGNLNIVGGGSIYKNGVLFAGGSTVATVTVFNNFTGSVGIQTLLTASTGRLNASFYNDSASACYLKLGESASTTSFTVKMAAYSYYEYPINGVYTGQVTAVWDSAAGSIRVTEYFQ